MRDEPGLAGIVIGHGTATLEETAYMLGLTLKVEVPVVLVGSQRPLSGLSTDAANNLVAAVRTAGSPTSRGRGVLVVLNDEIQAARDVTKTSTFRLQTFRTPDFGVLGHADGEGRRHGQIALRLRPIKTRRSKAAALSATKFVVTTGSIQQPRADTGEPISAPNVLVVRPNPLLPYPDLRCGTKVLRHDMSGRGPAS